jgi:hypothetical protein
LFLIVNKKEILFVVSKKWLRACLFLTMQSYNFAVGVVAVFGGIVGFCCELCCFLSFPMFFGEIKE